ncbi:leucine rich repeat protein [Treponema socranskii subsp. socranskii VPI DR56BR1116 = ATCC 35536]|uniref:Leucine rich repeat protein n=2 Tax=Treponema socranskii subsp. socranskii VPI DR56BR1116 = ATCC 35536 TaxID=1125725 RepID=U1FMA8_TRESO|nr:leucine-rich repeat protein [Treponema socranskii]ERF60571.1 leucine rich repeat protein [Treponema socranskii subsp. socranskii VPI DR56BR1116 = ATCC 35536]
MSGFNSSNKKTRVAALVSAALLLTGLAISCSNGSDSGGCGTPPVPPPVTKYKVELDHTIGGNVKVTPALSENGMAAENTELTFTATPLGGYILEKWELNGTEVNGTALTYTLKVTANVQVKVFFKRKPGTFPVLHTVTLTPPVHGRVTTVPELPNPPNVPYGSEITFKAVPDAGYAVNKWTVSAGSFLLGGTDGSTSATLKITEDVTVTVTFKQVLCKIDFGVDGGNGTLTAKVDGSEISSGDTVEHGKTVVFKATPAGSSCEVEQWTNNGTPIAAAGTNATYNHTVTAAANIKVKFKSTYTGPALTLDTRNFTKEKGQSFTYTLVTSGSGSYTATPETAGIITLDTANLNNYGNITVTCNNAGSTRIKVVDTVSGQTALSGTITVKPSVVILDYFEEAGVRYYVTDKTARQVSVTAFTDSSNYAPYTGTSLTIPKEVTHDGVTYTVTGIERPDFWGATLQSVTVASDNAYLSSQDGVIFNKDNTVLLGYLPGKPDASYTVPASVTKLGKASFSKIPAITSVTLPNGLKSIEDFVFNDCPNLATLNLPASLEYIGDFSIRGLKVSSMVIPENITDLCTSTLADCPELTSVELPSTLTQIWIYALSSDPKLKTVTCKAAKPPAIPAGAYVFEDTPIASATLRVPAGSKALYQAAEGWKDFGTIVEY